MAEPRKPRARKPKPLTAAALENAALYYLGRFATSSGNLRRVLMRKVARSTRNGDEADAQVQAQTGARLVEDLIARYLKSGLLNDRAYAEQRAANLQRRGTSRFSIAGKLAQKGVAAELVSGAIESLEEAGASEIAAACAWVRRRRLGPYRAAEKRAEFRQKDLASLARAGFRLDLARRVLKAPDIEALERLARGEDDSR